MNRARDRVMSGVRRAALHTAVTLQSRASGYGDKHHQLSLAAYTEKCVTETLVKLSQQKLDAAKELICWSSKDSEGAALKSFYECMAQVDSIWCKLHNDYAEQYDIHRKAYKDILKGETTLDETRKEYESYEGKLSKLRKQIDACSKKDKKKRENLEEELQKAMAITEKALEDLNILEHNHEKFKLLRIQQAMHTLARANTTLHEKCLNIVNVQEQLANIFLHQNVSTNMAIAQAQNDAKTVIQSLYETLAIPPPQSDAAKLESFKLYVTDDMLDSEDIPTYNPVPVQEISDHQPWVDNPGTIDGKRPGSTHSTSSTDRPLPPLPIGHTATASNDYLPVYDNRIPSDEECGEYDYCETNYMNPLETNIPGIESYPSPQPSPGGTRISGSRKGPPRPPRPSSIASEQSSSQTDGQSFPGKPESPVDDELKVNSIYEPLTLINQASIPEQDAPSLPPEPVQNEDEISNYETHLVLDSDDENTYEALTNK